MNDGGLVDILMRIHKENDERQMMRDLESAIDEIHDLKKRVKRLENKVSKKKGRKR